MDVSNEMAGFIMGRVLLLLLLVWGAWSLIDRMRRKPDKHEELHRVARRNLEGE